MVLVPVDNAEGVGLRPAISDSEVNKLYLQLGNGKIDDHQNWKGRFKDNSDKMRTGSIREVIDVLKGLNFLSKSKNLSFREKRMLDRAKFLVISEISAATDDSMESVEDKVTKALERCLVNRARQLEKAKAAKVAKKVTKKVTKKVAKKVAKVKKPAARRAASAS